MTPLVVTKNKMEDVEMKFSIPNDMIKDAIRKGGVAAMTNEAKNKDQLMTQPTLNCVKIQADDKFLVVESSVPHISSRFKLPIGDKVKVEGEGGACVEASAILRSLEATGSGNLITVDSAPMQEMDDENGGEIKKNVKVQYQAHNEKNKREMKVSANAFSTDVFPEISYGEGDVILTCKAGILKSTLDDTIFSANIADYVELLDNVAIVRGSGKLVFGTCDGKRSVLKIVDHKTVSPGKGTGTTLVKVALLLKAASVFDADDDVTLMDAGDGQNVILKSSTLEIKISMAPVNMRKKFPNVANILAIEVDFGVTVPKPKFSQILNQCAAHNIETGEYFVKSGSDELSIISVNEGNGDNCESNLETLEPIPKSLTDGHIFMSTTFMQDMVKRIPGNKVKLSFTSDERKIKVEDADDPSYVYILMRMMPQKGV